MWRQYFRCENLWLKGWGVEQWECLSSTQALDLTSSTVYVINILGLCLISMKQCGKLEALDCFPCQGFPGVATCTEELKGLILGGGRD